MRSMTGFGRAATTLPDGTEATVIVRGVNHRFLDVAVKLRDELAPAEALLRKAVGAVAQRGHVDVLVRTLRPAGRTASFDEASATRYAAAWREAAGRTGLPADLTARDLLGLPGVVRGEEAPEPDEAVLEALAAVAAEALAAFDAARQREGEALAGALDTILLRLEQGVGRLDDARQGLTERIQATLSERIRKLAASVPLDEARLAQEVALLADRADISEEVDRLKAHLAEARRLLGASGPVGKRLDHLTQELHREVNTAGAKVREGGATRLVLDLKSDLEAFKEQVQNVE
ncbi:MAG TPA: YicC/YloC family endoribonuclease [Thermoanaerobaculia bacterium]|nr:YicC/YloC family endoribonuclease [Thermoanaerobaculia bacterium]